VEQKKKRATLTLGRGIVFLPVDGRPRGALFFVPKWAIL
jgi:hypothetical protein